MAKVSDFKPLEKVVLPDLGPLECSGLILVVGPNSSGKTQFLQDIYLGVVGEPRSLVVAKEVRVRHLDLAPLVESLEAEGFLVKVTDNAGQNLLRPSTTYVGTGIAPQQIQVSQSEAWYRDEQDRGASSIAPLRRRSEYLAYFGRFLVTALFLDRRLTSMVSVGLLDFETQPPQADLHALYLNETAKAELLNETQRTFGRSVVIDASRGNTLCLRVSSQRPTPDDRLSPKKMMQMRTIETEGDGLKSYVATCVALLLGRRPVCLVDEPEMCLHPPQAYNLGRFIGRFAASRENATFVATHSSHVLRGVIQTTGRLQIVRLTRSADSFQAHVVPPHTLAEALVKPTVRAQNVLDGIFSEAVIVVEADTDRVVYQAVLETIQDEVNLDIHFAPVGGTGGIADTCGLYKTLRIPMAVIADLDVVVDLDRLRSILRTLTSATLEELLSLAKTVAAGIKTLPPGLAPEVVKRELSTLAESEFDWTKEDDTALRRSLSDIARRLDRMRRIKEGGGLAALPPVLRGNLERLIEMLEAVGLFVVPVGDLEEWLAFAAINASKDKKWAWANEAAQYVRSRGAQDGDVWDFMRRLARYLRS